MQFPLKSLLTRFFTKSSLPEGSALYNYRDLMLPVCHAPVQYKPPSENSGMQAAVYERWMSIATIVYDTPCGHGDIRGIEQLYGIIKSVADNVRTSQSTDHAAVPTDTIKKLIEQKNFIFEMAKFHAEKGSEAICPPFLCSRGHENVVSLFAEKPHMAAKAAGRENAGALRLFAEKLENLTNPAPQPPRPFEPSEIQPWHRGRRPF